MRKIDPERQKERREQILDAALRCFRRDGFRGASTSDICKEAGMSPGHMYHYFPSKEAIVKAIVDDEKREIREMFRSVGTIDELLDMFDAGDLDEEGRLDGVMMAEIAAEGTRNPDVADLADGVDRAIISGLANLLRDGQQQGKIDPELDVQAAATLMLSLYVGVSLPSKVKGELGDKRLMSSMSMMIRRLIAPPKGSVAASRAK